MEITLAPHAAARIRGVLGNDVDLSPAAVPQVLARLAEEAPDVYSKVLDELSGSHIRLDSERALHQRHRRSVLRRVLFGWGEYESDAGDRLLAKRRIAAAVPIALAALMLMLTGFSSLLGRPHRVLISPAAAHRLSPLAAQTASAPTHVRAPRGTERAGRGAGADVALTSAALPSPLPSVPAFPLPTLLPGRARGDAPPAPVVFSAEPSQGSEGRVSNAQPRSPVVYARDTVLDTAETPVASARAGSDDGRAGSPVRKIGERIPVRLVTGIIAASGVLPVPVVAEGTADGTTWLGQASAQPDGRVHISFQLAGGSGLDGAAAAGVALEPDRLSAGLPGRVTVRRRAAAAAAMGAVVQAASDYAQALARAGQISITDSAGLLTVAGAAPAWTYAAARLGDALSTETPGATVETIEIPAGTPLIILVTETR